MVRFLGNRLISAALIMFLASVLIFVLVASSGDPLFELRERQPAVPEPAIQAEEARLGMDQNLLQRYLGWIGGIGTGEVGPSVIITSDIGAQLATRVGFNLRLDVVAIVIAFIMVFTIDTLLA